MEGKKQLSDITPSIENRMKCSINECKRNLNERYLLCHKCKRRVHYRCTLLPLYQLQQFLNFSSHYHKYVCVNCVEIQEDLQYNAPMNPDNETFQAELEKQKKIIATYEFELKNLRAEMKKYASEDNPTKKRKLNQQKELEEQNEILSEEVKQLRQEAEILQTLLEEETLDRHNQWESNHGQDKNTQSLKDIESLLSKCFDQLQDKISRLVEEKITEKQVDDQTLMKVSFADTLKKNFNESTIENAIRDSINNELVQDSQRTKREKNIIIHGIAENKGTEEEKEDFDKEFIASFLRIIGAYVNPAHITRLGKPSEGKIRPVKLVMNTREDKVLIMSRLINLKNADDQYRRVSVKDDYTLEERELIKKWLKKADEKNKLENTTDWKIRGTPKSGLRLIKITKTKETPNDNNREESEQTRTPQRPLIRNL